MLNRDHPMHSRLAKPEWTSVARTLVAFFYHCEVLLHVLRR